jgi:hypothetical protein
MQNNVDRMKGGLKTVNADKIYQMHHILHQNFFILAKFSLEKTLQILNCWWWDVRNMI